MDMAMQMEFIKWCVNRSSTKIQKIKTKSTLCGWIKQKKLIKEYYCNEQV